MPQEEFLVSLEGVAIEFGQGKRSLCVLKNFDLHIPRGSRTAIVGPSGCGKTTILRTIAGLVEPSEGIVTRRWRGHDTRLTMENLFGIMFQEPALLDWRTVWGNIALPFELGSLRATPKPEIDDRVGSFINLVGLSKFQDFRPNELSGGMKQRVSLARSLVTRPAALLLDEPFAALDAITKMKLWLEFDRLVPRDSTTAILVTHSIDEALLLCDRVLVLAHQPAQIVMSIEVPFPKIRDLNLLDNAEFIRLAKKIRESFLCAEE